MVFRRPGPMAGRNDMYTAVGSDRFSEGKSSKWRWVALALVGAVMTAWLMSRGRPASGMAGPLHRAGEECCECQTNGEGAQDMSLLSECPQCQVCSGDVIGLPAKAARTGATWVAMRQGAAC